MIETHRQRGRWYGKKRINRITYRTTPYSTKIEAAIALDEMLVNVGIPQTERPNQAIIPHHSKRIGSESADESSNANKYHKLLKYENLERKCKQLEEELRTVRASSSNANVSHDIGSSEKYESLKLMYNDLERKCEGLEERIARFSSSTANGASGGDNEKNIANLIRLRDLYVSGVLEGDDFIQYAAKCIDKMRPV